MILILSFTLSFITSVILMPAAIWLGEKFSILDYPDKRKVHALNIPRTGGIALTIGITLPLLLFTEFSNFNLFIILGFILLIAINILDDIHCLEYKIKLAVQLLATFIIVYFGNIRITTLGEFFNSSQVSLGIFSVPITIFYILAVTNSINFVDGLDGLVGGICLLIFAFIAMLAYQSNNFYAMLTSVCILGSLFGFLKYNTFPATIFLGDTGSIMLGFLASILTILITQNNSIYSPSLSLLILGFPLLDAFLVIIERFKEGRSIFKADKKHFHHKLLKVGFSHTGAVIAIYAIHSLFILSAFIFRFKTSMYIISGYLLFTSIPLTFILLNKNINLVKIFPKGITDFYYSIKYKINKKYINNLCFNTIFFIVILFFSSSTILINNVSEHFAFYFAIIIISIVVLWVLRKKSILFQANRLAIYFLGSYFIYMLDSSLVINPINTYIQLYDYFYIFLGIMFMLSNYSDLEKSYYDPTMYLICFIALIALSMSHGLPGYHKTALLIIKMIVLSINIDLIFHKYKLKYSLLTIFTLTILVGNLVKIFIA